MALVNEIRQNQGALMVLSDSLAAHAGLVGHHILWMEEVEPAGSATLWEGMRRLRVRPSADLARSTFDDLVAQNRLVLVVPDDAVRRRVFALYAEFARIDHLAEPEYEGLVQQYERVLGSGEWRNLLGVSMGPGGPEAFGVDYRQSLADLVADDHIAVLRRLVRGLAGYGKATEQAIRDSRAVTSDLLGETE